MAHPKKEDGGEIVRVVFYCILWYCISSGNNVVGKTLLNDFPYPLTVTMVQLVSIAVYSSPVLKWMAIRKRSNISLSYYKKIIIPLAFGKFVSSVSSHVSIWRVPVSYAHTVKATMPFFTILLARILMGEKQTTKVYFSLVPIILGVALATITELSFDMLGLVAALFATCGFSLQNIYSKKVLNDTGIHHLRLLHLLGYLALFMFLPVWILTDARQILADKTLLTRRDPQTTLTLLVVDGGLSWLQNFVAFTILHHVTPLTYAVANATKRISIITVSLVLLGNPITIPNVAGMFLAIMGVLGYNKAKYDANQSRKKCAVVPLSQVTSTGYMTGSNGVTTTLQDLYHPLYQSGSVLRTSSSPLQQQQLLQHPHFSSSTANHNNIGEHTRRPESVLNGAYTSPRIGEHTRRSESVLNGIYTHHNTSPRPGEHTRRPEGVLNGTYTVTQNGYLHSDNMTSEKDRLINANIQPI